MFDEREAEAASHVDVSPHVLEVWKLKPEEPEETLPQGEPLPQLGLLRVLSGIESVQSIGNADVSQ